MYGTVAVPRTGQNCPTYGDTVPLLSSLSIFYFFSSLPISKGRGIADGIDQAVRPTGRDILAWSHHSRRRPAPIHHVNMVWRLSMVSIAGHRADGVLPAPNHSSDEADEARRIGHAA